MTGYQYRYKADGDNWTALQSTTSISVSLNSLAELTTYIFQVKAIYSEGESDFANITFTTKQIPVVVDNELPYKDGFEGERCNWELLNGNLTNGWVWGNAVNNGGEHSLYISNDGGTSNTYSHSSALVYAYKSFTLEQGLHTFSYDWKANGENKYDFLRVALIPDSVELVPVDYLPSGFGYDQLSEGWIALDGGTQLNLSAEWNSLLIETTIPVAGTYKMAFIWRNDHSSGNNPPAAVDNVSISRVWCPMPAELSHIGMSDSSVTLSWTANGTEDAWEIDYREEGETEWQLETAYENPYTLQGLTESTT